MVKKYEKQLKSAFIVLLLVVIGVILYNMYLQNVSIRFQEEAPSKRIEPFSAPSPTIIVSNASPNEIQRSPKEVNAIDRFWNPLRFPYRSDYFYDQGWYPNNNMPFQVLGGGRRMAPTLGGTEIPIPNPTVPINIAEAPIAPINITTRGPRGVPQQLGVIYKAQNNGSSDHNTYLPLFGMKEYPNSDSYQYYTAVGQNSQIKVPLMTKYRNQPLGDGDEVIIKGQSEKYRCVLYSSDFPQYIPYA